MKKLILTLFSFLSTVAFANRNDSIITKYFLSDKVQEILIKDSNNTIIKNIMYSRKGCITTVDYIFKDTIFRVTFYQSGNVQGTGILVNNKKDGAYRYFIDKPDLMVAINGIYHYKNGKLNGEQIVLKSRSIFEYDTFFVWNSKDGKQSGPSLVYYRNQIIMDYYYNNKQILTLFYYKESSSISYKINRRRFKKYKLDTKVIIEEFKRYFPGAPFDLLKMQSQ